MTNEEYLAALIAIKGIGPATAEEIMGEYETADALVAAIKADEYEGQFADELMEALAEEAPAEPDEPEPDVEPEPEPAPAPKAKSKRKMVRVRNNSLREVKINSKVAVARWTPGSTLLVQEKLTKTKEFKTFEARKWLVVL